MISRQEILDFSREFGIRANIIEKDYVLYWILAGIANHPELGHNWVFKGGTCLKKCYFETYRFSEDLDFTLTDTDHIDQDSLQSTFGKIADWVNEMSGIEIPQNLIRFDELLAEKIRALAERLRPRDLYNVVHIYRHTEDMKPNRSNVLHILQNKCKFKKIPMPTIDILEHKPELEELESEWENMLAHQLPLLPAFAQFWQELPLVFEWLYQAVEKAVPIIAPLGDIALDETWQPPHMAQMWNMPVPLEVIRFAASNRLCIDLKYDDSHRLIEPYSLRRTRDGNLLLFAVKHNTGQLRSYRVDKIQSIDITTTVFVPRYIVELTTTGSISAPQITRESKSTIKSRSKAKRDRA